MSFKTEKYMKESFIKPIQIYVHNDIRLMAKKGVSSLGILCDKIMIKLSHYKIQSNKPITGCTLYPVLETQYFVFVLI